MIKVLAPGFYARKDMKTPVYIAMTILVLSIPANFNSFFYLLQGSVEINGKEIFADQAAWLDLYDEATDSELNVTAGAGGLRMVFYAAKPTGEPIVSQGPFIADSPEEIKSLYAQFRHGEMQHISEAPAEQKIFY